MFLFDIEKENFACEVRIFEEIFDLQTKVRKACISLAVRDKKQTNKASLVGIKVRSVMYVPRVVTKPKNLGPADKEVYETSKQFPSKTMLQKGRMKRSDRGGNFK